MGIDFVVHIQMHQSVAGHFAIGVGVAFIAMRILAADQQEVGTHSPVGIDGVGRTQLERLLGNAGNFVAAHHILPAGCGEGRQISGVHKAVIGAEKPLFELGLCAHLQPFSLGVAYIGKVTQGRRGGDELNVIAQTCAVNGSIPKRVVKHFAAPPQLKRMRHHGLEIGVAIETRGQGARPIGVGA